MVGFAGNIARGAVLAWSLDGKLAVTQLGQPEAPPGKPCLERGKEGHAFSPSLTIGLAAEDGLASNRFVASPAPRWQNDVAAAG